MKTPKSKEDIINEIINYIKSEDMNLEDAEHFCEEIKDEVYEFFNSDDDFSDD